MTKESRTQFCLPRIRKVKLCSFSLFSLEPEIDIDFPDGVFCLAGANGLGKSTFLLALNYGITGIVPEPGRSFPSVEEYYRFCREFTREFFSGRVKEDDRDIASVYVEYCFIISRLSSARRTVSSSEEFSGHVPRIQRFPSSSSGINTHPRNGRAHIVATTTPASVPSVNQRCFMHRTSCR